MLSLSSPTPSGVYHVFTVESLSVINKTDVQFFLYLNSIMHESGLLSLILRLPQFVLLGEGYICNPPVPWESVCFIYVTEELTYMKFNLITTVSFRLL